VFFSRRPDPLSIVRQAVDAGQARLLIRVSRADLIALYSMADVFAFPSWIEGFGIPILEAMTCGAPVVASDRGALPEVVGGAGLLVDAEDASGLATHLESVLSRPNLANDLRRRGVVHASRFSWQRTAAAILESYARALASPALGHLRAVSAA
jgi:glycosyltransferase involved in cell wall biosynthesis